MTFDGRLNNEPQWESKEIINGYRPRLVNGRDRRETGADSHSTYLLPRQILDPDIDLLDLYRIIIIAYKLPGLSAIKTIWKEN